MKRTDFSDRIVQIMPADGWMGVYVRNEKPFAQRLVGWALIEDPDDEAPSHRSVIGLDSGDGSQVDYVSRIDNFLGYIHQTEIDQLDEFYGGQARGYVEMRQAKLAGRSTHGDRHVLHDQMAARDTPTKRNEGPLH